MATSKKEVAVKESGVVVGFDQDVPDYLKGQVGNRGSEEVEAKDMVLPRLEIVQSQSPIKDEGAAEGTLFNSATGEQLGDIAYFVPVYFRTEYIVWKDQNEGGGFFGSYPIPEEAKARLLEKVTDDGEDEKHLEVVDTPVHFGLLVFPDGSRTPQQIVISMAKSKAKVSRKFNATIQIAGGDRFSRVYKITTFKDKNKKNQTFFNYVIQPAGFVPEHIYREAEKTYSAFKTQGVQANHAAVINDGEGTAERGDI